MPGSKPVGARWKHRQYSQRPFSAYVSAQSEVPMDAIVRVRIYAGGKQIKESESYGRYAIASATANIDW